VGGCGGDAADVGAAQESRNRGEGGEVSGWVVAIGIIVGVGLGLIRLAYLIGRAHGDIDGFTRGYKRGQEGA
jgi:hypothetical protein